MIYTGVDLLTIAPVLQDDIAGYKAGQPALIPVSSVDIPEEGKSKAIVKDGYVIGFHKVGSEQTITINCAGIAPDLINTLLYNESNILIDSGLNEINYFALGFRILQSDGSYTYYCYQKGTIKVNAKSIETKQGTAATVESITFTPVVTKHKFAYNGKPSRKIVINTNSHVVNVAGWLAIVWTPDNFLPIPQPKIEVENVTEYAAKVSLLQARETDTIYYTTDGTTPTLESAQYTAPFTVEGNTEIKAVECATCKHVSTVASAFIEGLKVLKPEIYAIVNEDHAIVIISCKTKDATIMYTTDGSEPSATHGTIYNGEFVVNEMCTIKAFAIKGGLTDSYKVQLNIDNIKVKNPEITASIVNDVTMVKITCATPNARIIYRTDDKDIFINGGTLYTNEFAIYKNTTIRALATKTNCNNADIVAKDITVKLPNKESYYTLAVSEGGDSATITLNAALSTNYGNTCKCRYTLDGSEPTGATETILNEGDTINLPNNSIFKAIITADNNVNSDIVAIYGPTLKTQTPKIILYGVKDE